MRQRSTDWGGSLLYKRGIDRRPEMSYQLQTALCTANPIIPIVTPVFQAVRPLQGEDNHSARERRYHQLIKAADPECSQILG